MIVTGLLLQLVPPIMRPFLVIVALQQAFCIFGLHAYYAAYNKALHRPARRYHRLVMYCKYTRLQFKLRLHHFVAMYLTRRPYGINYSKSLGIITMASYAKVKRLELGEMMFALKFWNIQLESKQSKRCSNVRLLRLPCNSLFQF